MPAKALLIGINDYAPVGPGGPDLRGCVNDVQDAANTFLALGVVRPVPGSLRILTDSRATRANILNGVKWLLTPTAGIDQLILYYSGHGSWCVDTSGDDVDGKDETICPFDYATAGMIKDDEFRKLFTTLKPGVTLEVILDSCHSGTGTREAMALEMLPKEQRITVRFVEPPLDERIYSDGAPALPARGFLKEIVSKQTVPVPGMHHVLWAACKDNQTAGETLIGGVYRGVFSYCFFRALRRAGIHVARTRLDALVSADLRKMGYSQVPQLEGDPAELRQEILRALAVGGAR